LRIYHVVDETVPRASQLDFVSIFLAREPCGGHMRVEQALGEFLLELLTDGFVELAPLIER
jgi:hypothetical protein